MSFFRRIWIYIRNLPRAYQIIGAIVVVAVVVLAVHFATRAPAVAATPPQISHVQIASVASLSSQTGPLPVTGKVTSVNQATILAESSGEITALDHQLGDTVQAGAIIATMENSSQEAAVVQAQGAYAAAQAALASASGSTAQNTTITSQQAATSASNAALSVQTALSSAYAALNDAVDTKADALFSNPQTPNPSFLLTIPNNQLAVNVVNEQIALQSVLPQAQLLASGTATSSVDAQVTAMTGYAQQVNAFITDMVSAANIAEPNQSVSTASITAAQASLSAARTEVVSAIASLTSAKSSYDAAQTGAQTAANSAGSGTQNSIAAAQANVQEALGSLESAQAALEKTIIRSPISGTIVSLSITQGDYVSSFAQVAEVSNPSALEVDTEVTPADAKTLDVGGAALINGSVNGVITSIAPAIDPTTNEIQVKIGISGNASSLTDGDTVTVALTRAETPVASSTNTNGSIVIPINAAKITPAGPVVFTVSSSTLVSVPITLGTILGDQVQVVSGLTSEMDIVTDARGLTDGQQVIVDPQ